VAKKTWADNKKKIWRDQYRVGADPELELRDFAVKFGIPQSQARELIKAHGNDREKLEAAARKLSQE
jgi:hypothetical protein